MKNNKHFVTILLVFIFSIVFLTNGRAQIYNGDLLLSSQDQIDAFSYTEVTGFLAIWEVESGNIVDISPLNTLSSLGGFLAIHNNATLTHLDGLENLTSVNGTLSITSNAMLTNLDGLQNITSVGGELFLINNPALTNLIGLQSIISVSENLKIYSNTALTNLDGLQNVTSVGGDLFIYDNPALTNLDGLQSLTSVGGTFYLVNNPELTNVDGLRSLTSIDGILDIDSNPALTNLDGLKNLTSVGWTLDISDNTTLTNLDGLQSLTSIGWSLTIYNNVALTNLDGLQSLTSVGIDLYIAYNNALVIFCGLYPLIISNGVGGEVGIWNNGVPEPTTVEDIIREGPCAAEDKILTLINNVEKLVNDGVLNMGQGNALTIKLNFALSKLNKGQLNVAINILNAFINQVNDFIAEGILTEEEGQKLILEVNIVIDQINYDNTVPKIGNDNVSEEIQTEKPGYYSLAQNYPNPFNPTTTIVYGLPEDAAVILTIYNVLGAEVMRFTEGHKTAGYHKVSFNASGLPTGIYFYGLQAGSFVETKKMLLLK